MRRITAAVWPWVSRAAQRPGAGGGYRFTEFFGLRANSGDYSYNHSVDSSDFNIDGKAKLKSIGVLADFYPFGGSFRISAGLRSNNNRFAGVAAPAGSTVDIGGDTYTADRGGHAQRLG